MRKGMADAGLLGCDGLLAVFIQKIAFAPGDDLAPTNEYFKFFKKRSLPNCNVARKPHLRIAAQQGFG
jgi:hypothetical protein